LEARTIARGACGSIKTKPKILTVSIQPIAKVRCHHSQCETQGVSMASISNLLVSARRAVDASDARLREAAEYIASAKAQGATQERIAKAVGRSPAWVSLLLRWRGNGFKGTPFGPQSHAARRAAQARARTFTRVKDATAATAEPEQTADAKAEAKRALFDFQRARAQAVTAMFGATISNGLRAQLVAALAALPSSHPVERVRARLGMDWEELLVPAAAESGERSKAA
jgi:hypothetical protein